MSLFKQNDPQINSEYLLEMYQNLLNEEKDLKNLFGYMENQADINEKMRAMLIDWIIDVHFKFKLKSDTLFLTVWLIDRYLSEKQMKRGRLQLLGVTSMLISCKYEEIYSPEVFDFVYITENSYEKKDIINLEFEILKMLEFNVTIPTSNNFYEIISSLLNFNTQEFYLGKYLLELFLLDYRSLKYKPSEIANKVCYIIFRYRNNNDIPLLEEGANDFIINYRNNAMAYRQCYGDISFLLENLESTQLLSVKKKYMTSACHRVGRVKKIYIDNSTKYKI
jgi:cyclin B